jgi:hypothetical protein
MYELKKSERYLRVNLLGLGPSSYKKRIYRAAVSQRLRNSGLRRLMGEKGFVQEDWNDRPTGGRR